MKLFGRFGFGCGLLAAVSGMATIAMKLFGKIDMTGNPLLLLTVLSAMAGLQFMSIGLLGEVCARIYFGSLERRDFAVRQHMPPRESTSRARVA